MQPTEAPEPSFDTLGAEFAFIYRRQGAGELKAYLAVLVETGQCRKEWLQQAADELMALRLCRPANIAAEAAKRCPSMADLRFWDYTGSPADYSPNIVAHWRAGRERKIARMREQSRALLRRAGVPEDWQDKIGRS